MRRITVGRLKTVVLALGLLVSVAGHARAEGFLVPYLGYNFGGDSNCPTVNNCEDKRRNFGVAVGAMGSVFGFEEDFGFAKDFFGTSSGADNSVFTMMSNVLIGVGVGRVQPFVVIGAGLIRPHTTLSFNQFTAEKNALGYDIGAGITGYFVQHVGIRGDIRRFKTLQDVPLLSTFTSTLFEDAKLDFWRASFGVAFRF